MRRHRRHHQVVERRCCAGALRLQHCGFGSRCQLCSQDTHWLHFSVFVDALHNHEAITTPSPLTGRLLCGRRVAAPPGRHCPGSTAPMSCTRSRTPKGCWTTTQRLGCEDMLTRHVAALVFLPCVSVSPCGSVLVLRGGTPGGCCAWASAPGVCHRRSRVGELPRHTPQSHFSVTFLVLTRDGSSLLFFDCGFCSVLLAVLFSVSSVIRAP